MSTITLKPMALDYPSWQKLTLSQKLAVAGLALLLLLTPITALTIGQRVNFFQWANVGFPATPPITPPITPPTVTPTPTSIPVLQTLTLTSSRDTYIFRLASTPDDGQAFGSTKLKASSSWPYYKPLVYFDLSQIPQGAEVLEAKFTLEVAEWDGITANSPNLAIARLSKPFDQNATWENDRAREPSQPFTANFEQNSLDITSWVQEWVNNQSPNYGLIISTNRNQTAQYRGFASSEYPDQAKRPTLKVTYQASGQPTQPPTPTPAPKPQTLKLDNPFDTYIFRLSDAAEDQQPFTATRLRASSVWPIYKPLFRYDLGQVPQGAKILEAKLTLAVVEWDGINASTPNLTLARLKEPFNQNATWENDTYLGPLRPFTANFAQTTIDITDWVQEWVNNQSPNYGLIISTNRNQTAAYRGFAAAEHSDRGKRPTLLIKYQ